MAVERQESRYLINHPRQANSDASAPINDFISLCRVVGTYFIICSITNLRLETYAGVYFTGQRINAHLWSDSLLPRHCD